MSNLFQAIKEAISENNFIEAIAKVQRSLGQDNFYNASIYFTIDSEDEWEDMSPSGRFTLLQKYITFEVMDFGSTLD